MATLFGTLKLAEMYGVDHDAAQRALKNLSDAVNEAAGGAGESIIALRGQRLQVNEKTMRGSQCGVLAVSYLVEQWARRNLAAVHIRVDAGTEELGAFAEAFHCLVAGEADPAGRLAADLVAAGVSTITILPRQEGAAEALTLTDQRESTMHSYTRGLRAFKDVLRQDGVADLRKIRRARRAVQGLVDSFLENEATVLALARVHGHDVKLFHHSLNVCVYSLAIGQRLSMSRRQLGELGLAALFHDIGKTEPTPAVEGESEEEAEERRLAQSPASGARLLLDSGTGHEAMLKAAVVAFEQSMHFDAGEAPHLFSRIITIADCYEALTCRRRPQDPEHSTYDAFQLMQAKAGTVFDPLLLKVLMGAVGIHPVGTVVELTTGEIAVVTGSPSNADHLDRPRVKILRQRTGELKRHETADLAEGGLEGDFLRSINRTLAPEKVFPTISDLVAAV